MKEDPEWVLAHYAFVASATANAGLCDLVCSPSMAVAYCPARQSGHPTFSFSGASAEDLRAYAAFFLDAEDEIVVVVNEEERAVVEEALTVLEIAPLWQMVFEGDPATLPDLQARRLTIGDRAAIHALMRAHGRSGEAETLFAFGPVWGRWQGNTLIALSAVGLRLPGVVEIAPLLHHPLLGGADDLTAVLVGLTRDLLGQEPSLRLFTLHPQGEDERALLEAGFRRRRPIYRMRCRARSESSSSGCKGGLFRGSE